MPKPVQKLIGVAGEVLSSQESDVSQLYERPQRITNAILLSKQSKG